MSEKFNPSNPEYKKVEDLPKEEQDNFADVGNGFAKKEAIQNMESASKEAAQENKRRGILQRIFNKGEVLPLDVLHGQAIPEDRAIESERYLEYKAARRKEERDSIKRWETKNPEAFNKLSLFESLLGMNPDFKEEVLPALNKFAADANKERDEASYHIFRESRKLAYQNLLPRIPSFSYNGYKKISEFLEEMGVFAIPSDWRTTQDDEEFLRAIQQKLELSRDVTDEDKVVDIFHIKNLDFGGKYQGSFRNISLYSAALPQYLSKYPIKEIEGKISQMLTPSPSESSSLFTPGHHDNKYDFSRYCPVEHLKGIDGISLDQIHSFEKKRREAMSMSKEQYAAFLDSERVQELEKNQKFEQEHVAREQEKMRKEKEEAEQQAARDELKKKLLD